MTYIDIAMIYASAILFAWVVGLIWRNINNIPNKRHCGEYYEIMDIKRRAKRGTKS